MSLLLAFHTAVSYLVAGQPLHRALHARLFPRSVDTQTRRAALDWLLCSAATLVLSLAIALAVPFFSALQACRASTLTLTLTRTRTPTLTLTLALTLTPTLTLTLQDLLGAVLGAPLVFGLPAFFFLRASRASGTPLRPLDLGLNPSPNPNPSPRPRPRPRPSPSPSPSPILALILTRHAAQAARPRPVRALPRLLHAALRPRRHRIDPRADPRLLDIWRRWEVAGEWSGVCVCVCRAARCPLLPSTNYDSLYSKVLPEI